MSTKKASDIVVPVAVINPDLNTAGTVTSGWVDASKFVAYQAILLAGDLGASATVDFKVEQAKDSSGTDVIDITGAAITQMAQGTDDNTEAVINIRGDNLDVANLYNHIRISLTVATASSDTAAVLLGVIPITGPASDNDLSTVAEIVTP